MTRADWPAWMPPMLAVVLGRGLAEPDMITADVVSIYEDISRSSPWQDGSSSRTASTSAEA
ncbi:hypothetical protein [Kribbella sp. NPDC051620]|uniref:hypothetical protein n=1 Tax=Kribbella sp. NPDC051620 TaxID=3364120 RepID=UPI0037B5E278